MTSLATDVMVAPSRGEARRADVVTLLTGYLFLLMAIPSRLVYTPLGGAGSPSILLGLLFLAWYLFNWVHPSSPFGTGRQPIRLAAVLFLSAVLCSYISATLHPLQSIQRNGADRGIVLTCGWLGVLLLTADGVPDFGRLQTLLRRIVFGGTAMAALGIAQFFTGLNAAQYIQIPGLGTITPYSDIALRAALNRPSATAIHPIEFGCVLAMILPLALHYARYAPPGLRLRRWAQVVLIAAALPLTVSRSAILGLAIGLIVIIPTWPKIQRRVAYAALLFSGLATFVVVHGLLGELAKLFVAIGTDASTQSRTSAYGHAAPLISAHPWFGQGFNVFLPSVQFFTDNQYLNSLIELGVLGLLALLGLFATGWSLARGARRMTANDEVRHLAQCLAASVAAAFAVFGTFDALYFPMAAALTFLLLGCTGAVWKTVRAGSSGGPEQQFLLSVRRKEEARSVRASGEQSPA